MIGSPSPRRPTIVVNESPNREPVRRALDVPLRDAARVQYSPLYCAIFNYAAMPQDSRALALGAARDAAAARFALRHMDQIRTLLADARRLFQRLGGEAHYALVQWNAVVDAEGYAGAAEQMAVREATEAVGGTEAQDFWLGFDLVGPELLQGYQGQVAAPRTRAARGASWWRRPTRATAAAAATPAATTTSTSTTALSYASSPFAATTIATIPTPGIRR